MTDQVFYKCVSCGSYDLHRHHAEFLCNECSTRYPVIDDIPIFVTNPDKAPSVYVANLNSEIRWLQDLKNIAEIAITKSKSSSEAKRIEQIISGTTWNIRLLEEQSISIANNLNDKDIDIDFLDWASVQSGLSFHRMLIYFYHDWSGTEEFKNVENFFCEAIEKYATSRESVAVLGAGACGLLSTVSRYFHDSYGIDLVLPALLAAKRLISGEPMTFYLEKAQWAKVQLKPPSNSPGNIHFAVANVMSLPFKDNSLSVVTTQFLLNLVGDPMRFVEEVYRVLKADGIWINFSHSLNINEDQLELGSKSLEEFIYLFNDSEFKTISTGKMRFKFHNVEPIYPSAAVLDTEVWTFVLKKTDQLIGKLGHKNNNKSLLQNTEDLWSKIPKIVASKRVTLSSKKTFSPNGIKRSSSLSIIRHTFDIPNEFAQYLERILAEVDGYKTVLGIYESLCSEGDFLTPTDFLRLMHCLSFDHYLIDYDDTIASA